jgi:hypothetical protein
MIYQVRLQPAAVEDLDVAINMRLKMLRPLQQDGWNGFRRRFKLWDTIPNDVRWLPRMPGVAAFSNNTCSENVPMCFARSTRSRAIPFGFFGSVEHNDER